MNSSGPSQPSHPWRLNNLVDFTTPAVPESELAPPFTSPSEMFRSKIPKVYNMFKNKSQ